MEEKEEKLTPELILKMFEKTDKILTEKFAETDKRIEKMFAESKIEADRRTAESEKEWKEIRKQMKEVRKEIDGIGESKGKMAEEMIYNALDKDKTFANVKFDYLRKNVQIQSETYETKTELDILLVNGDTISIIETKYKVEKMI